MNGIISEHALLYDIRVGDEFKLTEGEAFVYSGGGVGVFGEVGIPEASVREKRWTRIVITLGSAAAPVAGGGAGRGFGGRLGSSRGGFGGRMGAQKSATSLTSGQYRGEEEEGSEDEDHSRFEMDDFNASFRSGGGSGIRLGDCLASNIS